VVAQDVSLFDTARRTTIVSWGQSGPGSNCYVSIPRMGDRHALTATDWRAKAVPPRAALAAALDHDATVALHAPGFRSIRYCNTGKGWRGRISSPRHKGAGHGASLPRLGPPCAWRQHQIDEWGQWETRQHADHDDEHDFNVAVDQARALLATLARRRRVAAVRISRQAAVSAL